MRLGSGERSGLARLRVLTNHSGFRSYVGIPMYVKGRDRQTDAIPRRQCDHTRDVRIV